MDWADGDSVRGFRLRHISIQADVGPQKSQRDRWYVAWNAFNWSYSKIVAEKDGTGMRCVSDSEAKSQNILNEYRDSESTML